MQRPVTHFFFWACGTFLITFNPGAQRVASGEGRPPGGTARAHIAGMTGKKDALWRWWSKFEQINQLAEIMSKQLSVLIDEYIAYQTADSQQHRGDQLVGFDEYIMHRAIAEV